MGEREGGQCDLKMMPVGRASLAAERFLEGGEKWVIPKLQTPTETSGRNRNLLFSKCWAGMPTREVLLAHTKGVSRFFELTVAQCLFVEFATVERTDFQRDPIRSRS